MIEKNRTVVALIANASMMNATCGTSIVCRIMERKPIHAIVLVSLCAYVKCIEQIQNWHMKSE